MRKYKSVSTHDLKGLKRAEWYKVHGWTLYRTGFYTLYFYKD